MGSSVPPRCQLKGSISSPFTDLRSEEQNRQRSADASCVHASLVRLWACSRNQAGAFAFEPPGTYRPPPVLSA